MVVHVSVDVFDEDPHDTAVLAGWEPSLFHQGSDCFGRHVHDLAGRLVSQVPGGQLRFVVSIQSKPDFGRELLSDCTQQEGKRRVADLRAFSLYK